VSHDSSVGIATGYGMDDRVVGFRVPVKSRIFSSPYRPDRPPLWSSGQNSWLQIQRSGFVSRRYQIFREVLDLERSPLSLVSTTEELLGRKSSGSDLENCEYGLGIRHVNHVAPSIRKSWH
jgi:hypothetical protein